MTTLDLERLEALQAKALTLGDAIGQEIAQTVANIIATNWSATSPADPGDPPAIRTGALAASVEVQPSEGGYQVGSAVAYAADLEHGTQAMPARPWLRPALESVRPLIPDIVQRWFKA